MIDLNDIKNATLYTAGLIFAALLISPFGAAAQAPSAADIDLVIDATDLPRKLLSAELSIPVDPAARSEEGTVSLWYPKWVPGTHGPGGPIANVAGMKVTDASGEPLKWQRSVGEFYRMEVSVPEGTSTVKVQIRYITNQPTTNSMGIDSFGSALVGLVSPGTVMMYPDGLDIDQAKVTAKIKLPSHWVVSSALPVASATGQSDDESSASVVEFEPVTARRLVDSPIMCGEHHREFDLVDKAAVSAGTEIAPHTLHLFSEAESVLKPHPEMLTRLRAMVTQAARVFDSQPFERFDVLLATTDVLSKNGLEHSSSTMNVLGQRALQEPDKLKGWERLLIPHEYVHAWCGKYRRPQGMVTSDFHTAKKMDLLWVYEGLTQYLGEVIEARAGWMTPDEFRHRFAIEIRRAIHQQGRDWRTLSDTGACSPILRSGSDNWPRLRRSQDYYMEGMLFWLEADAIIRTESDGKKSLDDFCHHFFARDDGDPSPKGYGRDDVIKSLESVVEFDWEGLIRRRVDTLVDRFDASVVDRLGYAIQYSNEKPTIPDTTFRTTTGVDLIDSIGAVIANDGTVKDLLLESAADQAGLGPGMKIQAVNNHKWSANRMLDAVALSATTGKIELMVVSGDSFENFAIEYDGGPRYMTLVQKSGSEDVLAEILKPL